MKTKAAIPSARYRNDVVFRSAQRLVATNAGTSNLRPAPRRAALVFGAAALLTTGIFIGRFWPRQLAPEEMGDRATVTLPVRKAPSDETARQPTPPSPGPVFTQKPVAGFAPKPASDPAGHAASETHAATAAPIPKRHDSGSGAGLRHLAPGASTKLTTTLVPLATLSGEFTNEIGIIIFFELSLRRDAATITGVVRYLSREGKRVAANSVVGAIRNRVVEIRETSQIWSSTGDILVDPESEVGRAFVFELPEANSSIPISGLWRRGQDTGKLELHFAAPW